LRFGREKIRAQYRQTSSSPRTTVNLSVSPMKTKRLSSGLAFSILFASASSLVPAATYTSTASGDWGNPAIWDLGVGFPSTYTGSDSVVIASGTSVAYDGSINPVIGGNLVVAGGNSLTIQGGTFTQSWVPGAVPPFGTTIVIGASHAVNGTGTLNIDGGGSFISGTASSVAIGASVAAFGAVAGSGTANINDGSMVLSGAASGTAGGQGLAVGVNATGVGVLNVGDGVGAADTALVDLSAADISFTIGGNIGEGAGNGTVTIKSDGRVIGGTGVINAGDTTGNGTLNIAGGTLAGGTGEINIGRNGGTGVFSMSAGTLTSGGDVTIGRGAGSTASGTISGGTASVNRMIVGRDGALGSSLAISGGSVTTANEFQVGQGLGSTGAVTISGTANITTNGEFQVGNSLGAGTVTMSGGSVSVNSWVAIGRDGGTGTLNLSGGTFTKSGGPGTFDVGTFGSGATNASGTLVQTGGNVVNTVSDTNIARDASGSGTWNMSGGTTSLSALNVGNAGNGTLIKSGGTLTVNRLGVASNPGAVGTATITGGATTINSGNGQSFVGNGAGAVGTLNVQGAILDNQSIQDFQIGFNGGGGTVNVTNGGTMNHNWWINLGRAQGQAGTSGTLRVSGAGSSVNVLPANGNNIHVNVAEQSGSTGLLEVLDGGKFNHLNTPGIGGGEIMVGKEGNTTGVLTVDGIGSEFNARAREFRIGATGRGTLNISNGGVVNFTSVRENGTNADGNFGVGDAGGATGLINMDNGTLNVAAWSMFGGWNGPTSTATLNMTNSTVNVLNHNPLNGNGDPTAGGHFFWGDAGQAVINQEGGAINAANWSAIGRERGGDAIYNLGVDGGGGSFNGASSLYVGRQSHGTINLGVGASVNVAAGEFNIGQETSPTTPSRGTINNNGGTVTANATFNLGRNGANGVTGTFTQTSGQLNINSTGNDSTFIGRDGTTGTLKLYGGTANFAGGVNIGMGGGGSTGVVNITNATMNVNGILAMGRETGGNATTATLNIGTGGVYNHPVGVGADGFIGWQNGATAHVNITNGGQMNHAWWLRVGVDPGSTGNILIDGAGSKFTQDSAGGARVMLGEQGNANITVSNGGVLEVKNGEQFQLGGNTDTNTGTGVGVLNIQGAGSLVTTNNYFRAGAGSAGASRASGTVNLSGGTLSTGQWMGFGHDGGSGTMNMSSGAVTTGTELHVGIDTNSRSMRSLGVFNMEGGLVTVGTDLFVGRNGGKGTFNKSGGTVNIARHINVAHGAYISSGGTTNIAQNFDIGNGGGVGTVTIEGGSTINASTLYAGTGSGSLGFININEGTLNLGGWSEIGRHGGTATVNVTGPNSLFDGSESDMQIGYQNGVGNINISEGGRMTHNWWIILGRDGGTGNMTVDGAGSKLTQGPQSGGNQDSRFNIGGDPNSGATNVTGSLTVSNGGLVERTANGGEVNVGRNTGSTGTVNIESGGRFTNVGGNTLVGVNGGIGTMSVTGSGSKYTTGYEINVGMSGTGTLNISDGAEVLTATSGSDAPFSRIGGGSAAGSGTLQISGGGKLNTNNGWFTIAEAGSTGTATVEGSGSSISTNGGLIVGWSGPATGTLNVQDNAVVNSTAREVSIGRDFNGTLASSPTGILNINSGGIVNGVNFRIGHGATGIVNIDGGTLNSTGGWAIVADGGSSKGTVNMDSGSFVTSDSLFIAMQGAAQGRFNQNGGTTNIGNELSIGRAGATGQLNLSGGTFNVAGWTVVGGGRDGGAGNGTINISNGAKFTHLQANGGDLLAGWQSGSQSTINIESGGTMEYNWWVRMGVDAGSTSVMNIDGADSKFEQGTVGGDTRFFVGEGGTGTISVSNQGLLKVRTGITFGGSQDEPKSGTGTLNLDGGHVRIGGEINFGWRSGSVGNATIDDGTMTNNSFLIIGRGGVANYTQNGGRVWNTAQELRIGNDAGANGTANINGGTLNSFSHAMVGESGGGTLNVSGGVVTIGCANDTKLFIGHLNGSSGLVNVSGGILDASHGSIEFNSNGGATTSVLNLDGGIVATRFLNNPTLNAVAQVNFNGGTLRAARDESNFIRGFNSSQLAIDAGGLTIDTNGFAVSVDSVFSGSGGITKDGFGQLNLTKNQLNTGITTVSAGVLNLDFSTAATATDIVSNAGLALNGGTLRVTSTSVANTQSFAGTQILPGASRLEVSESAPGTGAIVLGAITRTTAGGTADVGLVGNISTSNANTNGILGKGLTVNGVTFAINDGSGKIVGLADADYDAGVFGAAKNFDTLKNGGGATDGGDVHSLRFARAAADTVALSSNTTVGSGSILISSLVGANDSALTAAGSETITSGGLDLIIHQNNAAGLFNLGAKVTGNIALTKSGLGAMVLANGGNDYLGGTFINSGVVSIAADGALGHVAGALSFSSSSLSSGSVLAVTETMALAATRAVTLNGGGGGFSVADGKTLTVSQGISGSGGLGKLGTGTLILGGTNSYTGPTVIYQGALQLNGTIGQTSGFATDGNVTLGVGASLASSGPVEFGRTTGANVAVNVAGGSIAGSEVTIGGAGSAALTMNSLSTLAATCDLFVGRMNGSTSSLISNGGTIIAQEELIIGAAGGASGTVTANGGTLQVGSGLTVGNAGGTGVLNLNGSTAATFGSLRVGLGGAGTVNISGSSSLTGSNAAGIGFINLGDGNSGPAIVNQSGGSVSYSSWMAIGIGNGSNDPANSQYNISGGTLTGAGAEVGSDHGGTLAISGTASVNLSGIEVGTFGDRGTGSAGNGLLSVTGGTLTTNIIEVGKNRTDGGMTATGVFTQTGGLTTINGQLVVARSGAGGGTNGTVNLGGGELRVSTISKGSGATANLNFNGTVIKPNATTLEFITGFDTSTTEIQTGGAIFNGWQDYRGKHITGRSGRVDQGWRRQAYTQWGQLIFRWRKLKWRNTFGSSQQRVGNRDCRGQRRGPFI
jgi:fibronectin-binding autotransporter adhesin